LTPHDLKFWTSETYGRAELSVSNGTFRDQNLAIDYRFHERLGLQNFSTQFRTKLIKLIIRPMSLPILRRHKQDQRNVLFRFSKNLWIITYTLDFGEYQEQKVTIEYKLAAREEAESYDDPNDYAIKGNTNGDIFAMRPQFRASRNGTTTRPTRSLNFNQSIQQKAFNAAGPSRPRNPSGNRR